MQREPRRLAISLRLSVQEMLAVVQLVEELGLDKPSGVYTTAIRSLVMAVVNLHKPEHSDWTVESCLQQLENRGYDLTRAERNRRAVNSQIRAEQSEKEELPEPDLVGGLRALLNQPDEPETSLSDIEEEAREVGEQLSDIFARLEEERKGKK